MTNEELFKAAHDWAKSLPRHPSETSEHPSLDELLVRAHSSAHKPKAPKPFRGIQGMGRGYLVYDGDPILEAKPDHPPRHALLGSWYCEEFLVLVERNASWLVMSAADADACSGNGYFVYYRSRVSKKGRMDERHLNSGEFVLLEPETVAKCFPRARGRFDHGYKVVGWREGPGSRWDPVKRSGEV